MAGDDENDKYRAETAQRGAERARTGGARSSRNTSGRETRIKAFLTNETLIEINFLIEELNLEKGADAITAAIRVMTFLVRENQNKTKLYLETATGIRSRLKMEEWGTRKEGEVGLR